MNKLLSYEEWYAQVVDEVSTYSFQGLFDDFNNHFLGAQLYIGFIFAGLPAIDGRYLAQLAKCGAPHFLDHYRSFGRYYPSTDPSYVPLYRCIDQLDVITATFNKNLQEALSMEKTEDIVDKLKMVMQRVNDIRSVISSNREIIAAYDRTLVRSRSLSLS